MTDSAPRPLRVSVIIPCHNAGRWIVSALKSVVAQTLPAHEVIVIDDDSKDDSIAQIQQSGVPVKLLRVKCGNAAATRNAGIEVASGNWIALLDADDVWYPNHLSRAAEILGRTNDVAFMANHDWISLDGKPIPMPVERQCQLPGPAAGLSVHDFFDIMHRGFHFGHSTVLYERVRLVEVGMYDVSQRRRHDIDLWLRMLSGRTWAYDTVKQVGYRLETPGSISKAGIDVDYFYLRALNKNLPNVDSPLIHQHLSRHARRAMGIAFTDGTQEEYGRIRELAWPHLSARYKFFYRCGGVVPGMLRGIMRARRRLLAAQQNARQGEAI